MALVINSTPANYSSAHDDLIFVVYDSVKANDPATYNDFKYVCDVYIGTELVTRLKKSPQPDNKRGVFNIGQVVRSYVSAIFDPNPASLRAQQLGINEFFINATVQFGDEYNLVLTTNITVDSARTYFNHYNGRLIGQSTILGDYLNKVLSSRPFATPVYEGNNFTFIPFFPTDTDAITISIKKYDNSGVNTGTATASFSPSAANTLQLFNVSPVAVNASSVGFIDDSVMYYTVEFQTPNISDDSIYRFDLQCEPKYETTTLHFLNKFGGFESYDFRKVSRKSVDIERKDFGKLPYTITDSGQVVYFNSNKVYNETKSVFSSQFSEKVTLNTDILSDEEYTWLSELIVSPLVYIEMEEHFVPVTIKSTNYEFKKRINDKLTNLTIDIDFSETFNTQYR